MKTNNPIHPSINEPCQAPGTPGIRPPNRFVEPEGEGRLIKSLVDAAATHDPVEILTRAAIHFYSVRHPNRVLPPADPPLAIALADLSVTGRGAWTRFLASPPNDAVLSQIVYDQLKALHLNVQPSDVNAATASALDRAYRVAFALCGPYPQREAVRSGLGWIAVSGEDDPPHRPVNVVSAPYQQYEIPVTVDGVTIQTRFFIASASNLLGQPTAAPKTRSLSPYLKPEVPPGDKVALFCPGQSSSAEEFLDLIPFLHEAGRARGVNLSIIAFDLPCSGFSSMFDHTQVAGLGLDKTTFPCVNSDDGPIVTPALDFIENFILAFVDELDRQTAIKDRLLGLCGGGLGGSMCLRLGRRDLHCHSWLKNGIVSWNPASVCARMVQDEFKCHATKHYRDKWNEIEMPSSRVNYFKEIFDREIFDERGNRQRFSEELSNLLLGHTQPQMWYRDGWEPCKSLRIREARLCRQEIYNPHFRRMDWRIAGEQLIFSHLDRAEHQNSKSPFRYELNHARQLLLAGEKDNYRWSNIYDATRALANKMVCTPGRSCLVLDTGHSIHSERPHFLADQIASFLISEGRR